MIGIKGLKGGQRVLVVVLLIIALLLYALVGMRTAAQNMLDRPIKTKSSVHVSPGLGSSVKGGAIEIRDAVRSQVNWPSTIAPALPSVNANPQARLRAKRAVPPAVAPGAQKAAKGSASKSDKSDAATSQSDNSDAVKKDKNQENEEDEEHESEDEESEGEENEDEDSGD